MWGLVEFAWNLGIARPHIAGGSGHCVLIGHEGVGALVVSVKSAG